MKRFYTIVESEGGTILLDGRPVRTPARATLNLPTQALADAIADEWRAQGDAIDPRTMPLTGLANAAIDRIAPDPAAFAAPLGAYAETDLLFYRAEAPPELAARQADAWDPILAWARRRYDVEFKIGQGIVHIAQPAASTARLIAALGTFDPFALTAMSPLVTIGGSLVTALAIAEGAVAADAAFDLTHLDELWQTEHWGEDGEAARLRDARRGDFLAAARFMMLSGEGSEHG